MTWKTALAASALVAVSGAFAALGCGGDECTRADDHIAECAEAMGSSSSGDVGSASCAGARLCHSQCVNAHTCDQINGLVPAYTECIAACNAPKP